MSKSELSVIRRMQLYFSLRKFFKTVEKLYVRQFYIEPVSIEEKQQRLSTLSLCRQLFAIQYYRNPVEETMLDCLELFYERTNNEPISEIQLILMSHFIVLRDKYFGGR